MKAQVRETTGGSLLAEGVIRRAASWMARLWSGEASEAERAACAAWRSEHPDHERAWRALQGFDDKLGSVPGELASQVLGRQAADRGKRRTLMRMLGFALAGAGAVRLAGESGNWPFASADQVTRTGEVRELTLPDGTHLQMASATAFDLQFSATERRIRLRRGEILITSAHESLPVHRPFRVELAQGRVEALGTRFSVRAGEDEARVAVFEGRVELRTRRGGGQPVQLAAGQALRFTASTAGTPQAVSENAAAWTRGILVAEDMPLGELLGEIGRYRSGILRCDPAVAGLHVSGVFSLRDTDRALHNLALALPVTVSRVAPWWVSVAAR